MGQRRIRPTLAQAAALAFIDVDLGASPSRPHPHPALAGQQPTPSKQDRSGLEVLALGVELEAGRALHWGVSPVIGWSGMCGNKIPHWVFGRYTVAKKIGSPVFCVHVFWEGEEHARLFWVRFGNDLDARGVSM
jgi:hypothetical protein